MQLENITMDDPLDRIAYQQLLNQLPVGVVLLSTSGIVRFSNQFAQTFLESPLTGKVWHQVIALKQSQVLQQAKVSTYPFTDDQGQIVLIEKGNADSLFDNSALDAMPTEREKTQVHYDYIAEDKKSKAIFELAKKVAKTNATVLINGESGTGKEILARYIHENSDRANGAFIAINCAAIPDTMLEATLFGFEKGAFTGAIKSSAGKFELAHNGTLLLDEITEMSLPLQAKLLRVIQEREVERVGGKTNLKVDVRILATTNRNLKAEVAAGKFREDLFYRLNVFPIQCLPLRERTQDILPLCHYFIEKHRAAHQANMTFSPEAEQVLIDYHWPGNVREAQNIIQRALIVCENNVIEDTDLLLEKQDNTVAMLEHTLEDVLAKQEYQLILDALKETQGNRKKAAEKLDISARTLRYKLARMREEGIEF
jgi:two-component system response regulator FlrC